MEQELVGIEINNEDDDLDVTVLELENNGESVGGARISAHMRNQINNYFEVLETQKDLISAADIELLNIREKEELIVHNYSWGELAEHISTGGLIDVKRREAAPQDATEETTNEQPETTVEKTYFVADSLVKVPVVVSPYLSTMSITNIQKNIAIKTWMRVITTHNMSTKNIPIQVKKLNDADFSVSVLKPSTLKTVQICPLQDSMKRTFAIFGELYDGHFTTTDSTLTEEDVENVVREFIAHAPLVNVIRTDGRFDYSYNNFNINKLCLYCNVSDPKESFVEHLDIMDEIFKYKGSEKLNIPISELTYDHRQPKLSEEESIQIENLSVTLKNAILKNTEMQNLTYVTRAKAKDTIVNKLLSTKDHNYFSKLMQLYYLISY